MKQFNCAYGMDTEGKYHFRDEVILEFKEKNKGFLFSNDQFQKIKGKQCLKRRQYHDIKI